MKMNFIKIQKIKFSCNKYWHACLYSMLYLRVAIWLFEQLLGNQTKVQNTDLFFKLLIYSVTNKLLQENKVAKEHNETKRKFPVFELDTWWQGWNWKDFGLSKYNNLRMSHQLNQYQSCQPSSFLSLCNNLGKYLQRSTKPNGSSLRLKSIPNTY